MFVQPHTSVVEAHPDSIEAHSFLLSLSQLAAWVDGQLIGGDVVVTRVATDSRAPVPNALFIAIQGELFDGHQFLQQAKLQGAVAALVSDEQALNSSGLPGVLVKDTKQALLQLAKKWREQFDIPVVGVVGSNGKTTVKEMIRTIVEAHFGTQNVCSTQGNLNNDIGVPLTLLKLRAHHQVAVIEMGMNHPGETALLADAVQPTIAIINNAQREHQEFMKDVAAVAQEHCAVLDGLFKYERLPRERVAVLPREDQFFGFWSQYLDGLKASNKTADQHVFSSRLISFGLAENLIQGDVTALFEQSNLGQDLQVTGPNQQTQSLHLPMLGEHHARNALAALAVATALNIDLLAATQALSGFKPAKGRMVCMPLQGFVLIDDSYNANPDSVRAAIDVLRGQSGGKVLILGDMGEVGAQGVAFHEEIGRYARDAGVVLWALGDLTRHSVAAYGQVGSAHHETQFEKLLEALAQQWSEKTPTGTVLVKGSRFMKMERVVQWFVERYGSVS